MMILVALSFRRLQENSSSDEMPVSLQRENPFILGTFITASITFSLQIFNLVWILLPDGVIEVHSE